MISTATNKVTATLGGLSYPLGVVIAVNGEYAFVINQGVVGLGLPTNEAGSGSVSVINTTTNGVTEIFTFASNPTSVAVMPNGEYAYVTNYDSDSVSMISTATNTVISTVPLPVGTNPVDVAVTPNGNYAYVAAYVTTEYGREVGGTVSVISTSSNTVTATISGLSNLGDVAITPNSEYAYVTSGNSVLVISTATNTIMANVTGLSAPSSIAITPNGEYVYVITGDGTVSVISTARKQCRRLQIAGTTVNLAISGNITSQPDVQRHNRSKSVCQHNNGVFYSNRRKRHNRVR